MVIDPGCKTLIAGFEGGYHYKRQGNSSAEQYEPKAHKNRFSHPHDALQYAVIGGGEGRHVLSGNTKPAQVVVARRAAGPFERRLGRDRRGGHVSENAEIAARGYRWK
jgi:hypothetical protein